MSLPLTKPLPDHGMDFGPTPRLRSLRIAEVRQLLAEAADDPESKFCLYDIPHAVSGQSFSGVHNLCDSLDQWSKCLASFLALRKRYTNEHLVYCRKVRGSLQKA